MVQKSVKILNIAREKKVSDTMLQVVAMPRKIFASMYLFSFLSYSVRYFKREHDSGTFFKQPILYLVTNQGSNARKLHTPKSIDIY